MADPRCPDCAKPMGRRTARRGPNAGNEPGLLRLPGVQRDDLSVRRMAVRRGRRRQNPSEVRCNGSPGRCRGRTEHSSAPAGVASMFRCQVWSITTQDAQFAQTSFVARQDLDAFQPVDRDTRRVIDLWVKILSRGSASPIHPAAEEELLSAEGFGPGDFRPPAYVGDLAPRLQVERSSQLTVPTSDEFSLEERLVGSDAEAEFLVWLGKSHPELISFVTPQASLDSYLPPRASGRKGSDEWTSSSLSQTAIRPSLRSMGST